MTEKERIILLETKEGGTHWIYKDELTPDLVADRKADKDDLKGWKKYRKGMKDAGFDIGEVEHEC